MQISMSSDDLRQITFAVPGPVMETAFAVMTIQPGVCEARRHGEWRRRMAPVLAPIGPVRRLIEVLPSSPAMLDLFLPVRGAVSCAEGIERLRALGPEYYRQEYGALAAHRPEFPVPRWTEQLGEADSRLRRELVDSVQLVHDLGLRDRADRDQELSRREIDARLADFTRGGLDAMLDNLHPWIRWAPPVLSLHKFGAPPVSTPIPAGGRGVVLVPSVFAPDPIFFMDVAGSDQGMLVYPVGEQRDEADGWPDLAQLLGRTRAAVLVSLTAAPATTSELAGRCGISPASASEHARVLREGGLIQTDRSRQAHHRVTPTGLAVAGRGRPTDQLATG